MADEACEHLKVTVYQRLLFMATLYEPAEYAFKIVCNECGEELEETPLGASEKVVPWEDEIDE